MKNIHLILSILANAANYHCTGASRNDYL